MVILGHSQCEGCCKPPCQPITASISASFAFMHSFLSISHICLNSHLEVWLALDSKVHQQMMGEVRRWISAAFLAAGIVLNHLQLSIATMIDLHWPQVQPGERSCQFDSSLSPWLWHGLSLNGPFQMEIMSKPSIFRGAQKTLCQKTKQKSVNWMVSRPQAHPSPLHWAAAKVSDKREVSLPRPPEERQTTWSAMGGFWELMFLKEAGEGVLSLTLSVSLLGCHTTVPVQGDDSHVITL